MKINQMLGATATRGAWEPKCYTVICQWHDGELACAPWQTMAVVLNAGGGAQNAANEACLFLIWRQQGMATAVLVIEGRSRLHIPFDVLFDAQEYEETITFGAEIIETSLLDDVGSTFRGGVPQER